MPNDPILTPEERERLICTHAVDFQNVRHPDPFPRPIGECVTCDLYRLNASHAALEETHADISRLYFNATRRTVALEADLAAVRKAAVAVIMHTGYTAAQTKDAAHEATKRELAHIDALHMAGKSFMRGQLEPQLTAALDRVRALEEALRDALRLVGVREARRLEAALSSLPTHRWALERKAVELMRAEHAGHYDEGGRRYPCDGCEVLAELDALTKEPTT